MSPAPTNSSGLLRNVVQQRASPPPIGAEQLEETTDLGCGGDARKDRQTELLVLARGPKCSVSRVAVASVGPSNNAT